MSNPAANPDHGALSYGDAYVPAGGNGGYRVTSYDLEIDYRVTSNRFVGTATINAVADQDLARLSFDFAGLVATKVLIDGSGAAKVVETARKLTLTPYKTIRRGAAFTVVVRYGGSPKPIKSTWGELGWEELTDGVIVASQPNGAPSWFPCNDHPSNKALYRIRITCESAYHVLANGHLVSRVARSSRTTWTYETREPMASYLASVQIGRYRELTLSRDPVTQFAFVPASSQTDAQKDFSDQPRMMALFERSFGPYPFEDYSVVVTDDDLEIPLEAHGFAVFGKNHIDGLGGSERLIAHELAHSWFGNSLTAASWKDIWLHEGFACYAEWLWSEESGGSSASRLAHNFWAKLDALPQDLVIGDPGPAHMFDDRVYKRGALALHALRSVVGSDDFFTILTDWTAARRYGNVSTEEFFEHCQGYTRTDLSELFSSWLFDKRLPALPS
jgi:aminopeptidase N